MEWLGPVIDRDEFFEKFPQFDVDIRSLTDHAKPMVPCKLVALVYGRTSKKFEPIKVMGYLSHYLFSQAAILARPDYRVQWSPVVSRETTDFEQVVVFDPFDYYLQLGDRFYIFDHDEDYDIPKEWNPSYVYLTDIPVEEYSNYPQKTLVVGFESSRRVEDDYPMKVIPEYKTLNDLRNMAYDYLANPTANSKLTFEEFLELQRNKSQDLIDMYLEIKRLDEEYGINILGI